MTDEVTPKVPVVHQRKMLMSLKGRRVKAEALPLSDLQVLKATYDKQPEGLYFAYIQLHLGDPGPLGTDNPATETTRKLQIFTVNIDRGKLESSVISEWAKIKSHKGGETICFLSFWDSPEGGNFIRSMPLSGPTSKSFHGDQWNLTNVEINAMIVKPGEYNPEGMMPITDAIKRCIALSLVDDSTRSEAMRALNALTDKFEKIVKDEMGL